MDFQTPSINFTVLWKSLIPRLGVAKKMNAKHSSKFHQQGFLWQLHSSALCQGLQKPPSHPTGKGTIGGWIWKGCGIGTEVKRRLALKQEFKVGNDIGSQRCLVREQHAEHVVKEDYPPAAYRTN